MFGIEGGKDFPPNTYVGLVYSTEQSGTRCAAKSGSTDVILIARWEGQYHLWLSMSSSTDYIGN